MADIVTIDNIPFTGFVCTRNSTSFAATSERKFKSKCGSRITFVLSASGEVKKLDYGHEECKDGCIYCEVMAEDAKKIITGA